MEDVSYLQKLNKLHQSKKVKEYSKYMMQTLLALFKNKNINIIFDVGSGNGNNSSLFTEYFVDATVYSFDYVQHNLDYGVKSNLIKNPILSNIYDLEKNVNQLSLGKADLVFLGDVIEHLDNVSLSLDNIFNILHKGGLFIVHTPNAAYSNFFKTSKDPTHIHEFILAELVEVLEKHGFLVEYYYPSGIPIINKINPHLSQRLAYTPLFSWLFKYIKIFGPSIFMVAKKV